MIELIWAHYDKPTSRAYRLLVYLGTVGTLAYVLDHNLLGPEEITIIRQRAYQLSQMGPSEIATWLKEHTPGAMKAFRTLKANQLVVARRFPIKSLG